MSAVRRKDIKGRILHRNEIQRADGRYEYRYRDLNGAYHSIYSWRLMKYDYLPKGKRECKPLRDMECELYKQGVIFK